MVNKTLTFEPKIPVPSCFAVWSLTLPQISFHIIVTFTVGNIIFSNSGGAEEKLYNLKLFISQFINNRKNKRNFGKAIHLFICKIFFYPKQKLRQDAKQAE